MVVVRRFKGCPRCGGDLLDEPGVNRWDRAMHYRSCLQCGELQYVTRQPLLNRDELRGRPGRPRKEMAV